MRWSQSEQEQARVEALQQTLLEAGLLVEVESHDGQTSEDYDRRDSPMKQG